MAGRMPAAYCKRAARVCLSRLILISESWADTVSWRPVYLAAKSRPTRVIYTARKDKMASLA